MVFARKILPLILDNTENPFGSSAPIIGAARSFGRAKPLEADRST